MKVARKAPTEGAAAEAGETKEETPEPEVEEEEESTGKKEKEATDKNGLTARDWCQRAAAT